MDLIVLPDPADCARRAADLVTDAVEDVGRERRVVLGLATGSSPLPTYRELIERHAAGRLDFSRTTGFLLDEYIGLPAGHPQAYREVILREFAGPVGLDPGHLHSPDGTAADPATAASGYEHLIVEQGPVDLQILGIGSNGHIGFNEPGSPFDSTTRVTRLADSSVADNARFFDDPADVPRQVITQGLATISRARHLLLIATGAAKAAAVAAAVEGPATPELPASVLQRHPRSTLVIDDEAAAHLSSRAAAPQRELSRGSRR